MQSYRLCVSLFRIFCVWFLLTQSVSQAVVCWRWGWYIYVNRNAKDPINHLSDYLMVSVDLNDAIYQHIHCNSTLVFFNIPFLLINRLIDSPIDKSLSGWAIYFLSLFHTFTLSKKKEEEKKNYLHLPSKSHIMFHTIHKRKNIFNWLDTILNQLKSWATSKKERNQKAFNVKNRIPISVSISKATFMANRGKFKLYFIEIVPVLSFVRSKAMVHRWNGQSQRALARLKDRKYLTNFLMRFVWLSMPALNSQTTRKSSGQHSMLP